MDSLSTIHNRLNKIITDNGYSGLNVDIIEKLIAEGIYRDQIGSTVTLYENSRVRCKNYNSAIQHALDIGYSVPRGTCKHIFVANLIPVQDKSVKKFDDAGTVGSYHLYYANDYTFKSNVIEESVEFIVSKVVQTIDVTADINHLYCDFIPINGIVSSDYIIMHKVDEEYKPISTSELTEKFFKDYAHYPYLVQTFPDYSIRMYSRDPISGVYGFNTSTGEYRLQFVEYTNADEFSSSDIESISGFITEDNEIDVYYETEDIHPLSDPELIHMYSMSSYKNCNAIKGNYDIELLVKEFFRDVISDIRVSYSTTANKRITIYYTTYTGKELTSTQKTRFFNKYENDLGVELVFDIAHAYPASETFYIRVVHTGGISDATIQKYVSEIRQSIGDEFSPYKLISNIQNNESGIKLIEFVTADGNALKSDLKTVRLADNEYYDMKVIPILKLSIGD